jgi:hypothetical protein
MTAMETQTQQPVAPLKAAGLNNILNNDDRPSTNGPPLQLRDSGFYSTTEASSKRKFEFVVVIPGAPCCISLLLQHNIWHYQ